MNFCQKLDFISKGSLSRHLINDTERDRKQQVHANGVASDTRFISTDVPQGSILGPLLFTIFINDLPKSSTFFSTRLYADDTSLIASGSDLDSLFRKINNHLLAVYEWLCSNIWQKLSFLFVCLVKRKATNFIHH